jgi:hypothetical protein
MKTLNQAAMRVYDEATLLADGSGAYVVPRDAFRDLRASLRNRHAEGASKSVNRIMDLAQKWCIAWGEWAHDADPGAEKENAAKEALLFAIDCLVNPSKQKPVAWWNGIRPDLRSNDSSIRWGENAEDSGHDIPLFDGPNPIHTSFDSAGLVCSLATLAGKWRLEAEEYGRPDPEAGAMLTCADELGWLLERTFPTEEKTS